MSTDKNNGNVVAINLYINPVLSCFFNKHFRLMPVSAALFFVFFASFASSPLRVNSLTGASHREWFMGN
jgi:hypothetical protein